METVGTFNHVKDQLMRLEQRVLVDALLTLAQKSSSALMMVTSLISSPEQRVALFRSNIERITGQGRGNYLSGEQILDILTRSLGLLDPEELDPKLGLELMEAFYSTDSWAFESTNTLDFDFECLFSDDACSLLSEFAVRCPDVEHAREVVKRLLAVDDYGVRGSLEEIEL
ncbi:MAG: hypothetical protein M0Q37_05475 [Sphaerochaeta sp.]|nr:hypothetical protein [Sphaerochaeta sp.]